jgi:glutaredoxin-like protein
MEDLTSLSPKLHLKTYDFFSQIQEREEYGVEQVPAIVMEVNGGPQLTFYGLPGGYEFAAFLDVLNNLSRDVSPLSPDARRKLRRVNRPVHIQIFVTPSCQYCPVMVRMAQAMAVENRLIKADVVEVQEFPNLARRHKVSSVPKTVINDVMQLMGVQTEDQMLEKVMEVGYLEPEPKSGGKAIQGARA